MTPRIFSVDTAIRTSILNHMVKFYTEPLDRTFAALSDPTRRALVMRLAQEPGLSVSELAAPFKVSLPAIMKHLDVPSPAVSTPSRCATRSSGSIVTNSSGPSGSQVSPRF
jgi:DNA-binding transcriptional ArsR family regulator